ncbi:CD209 antigen-like [Seriola aureovittata]|uniref:CD209 antigen-like n=1 Tax=Seriola aureovittata TaxID=2871759 RepID=UPI0024BD90B8|nr:CD209 antigen-like [Seriola aureovittata]
MISNEEGSRDGKQFQHSTRSEGSVSTIRVGSRNLPLYPLVIVCLGLLNTILLLTSIVIGIYCGKVSEESTHHQVGLTEQSLLVEVNQLLIIKNEALMAQKTAEQKLQQALRRHQQLKLQLEQNKTVSDRFERQLETLRVEKATLESKSSDLLENCGRCPPGWLLLNTSCYFHAKKPSNPPMTWRSSRTDCISRGADLAVIDTWEEQVNIFEHLVKQESRWSRSSWKSSVGIWIGLTDIQTEGTWVWVNNVILDGGYWMQGEPNNDQADIEDCAALRNKENTMRTWFGVNCQVRKEWLCEMAPSNSG